MVESCSHKAVVSDSSSLLGTVLVAQVVRVPVCESGGRGFKSHLTPQSNGSLV